MADKPTGQAAPVIKLTPAQARAQRDQERNKRREAHAASQQPQAAIGDPKPSVPPQAEQAKRKADNFEQLKQVLHEATVTLEYQGQAFPLVGYGKQGVVFQGTDGMKATAYDLSLASSKLTAAIIGEDWYAAAEALGDLVGMVGFEIPGGYQEKLANYLEGLPASEDDDLNPDDPEHNELN